MALTQEQATAILDKISEDYNAGIKYALKNKFPALGEYITEDRFSRRLWLLTKHLEPGRLDKSLSYNDAKLLTAEIDYLLYSENSESKSIGFPICNNPTLTNGIKAKFPTDGDPNDSFQMFIDALQKQLEAKGLGR